MFRDTPKYIRPASKHILPTGIKQRFIDACTKILYSNNDDEIVGNITLPTNAGTIHCDYLVLVVFKVLLRTSVSPNNDLAEACTAQFKATLRQGTYITSNMLIASLLSNSYEAAQLSEAIKEVHKWQTA